MKKINSVPAKPRRAAWHSLLEERNDCREVPYSQLMNEATREALCTTSHNIKLQGHSIKLLGK